METINESLARTARGMWSFSDYVPGSATAEYNEYCAKADAIADTAKARETITPERIEEIDRLLIRYKEKMAAWINQGNAIECRCPSVMISGAGNFPVAKKEKQNKAREKHNEDYNHIQHILTNIKNVGISSGIVKSSDADAVEKLTAQIDDLKEQHTRTKAYNVKARKEGLEPLPWYQLPYLLKEIKRLQDRIDSIERTAIKVEKTEAQEQPEGFEIIHNTEAGRIQLIFPGKPSEEIRSILKHHAYNWSPRFGAWQRQLTENAINDLNYRLLKELKEVV